VSFIHGRPNWLMTSGLVGSLMSSVQMTRFFHPCAAFGRNASLRLLSTPKRCGRCRRVVEADLLRLAALRDVEDEQAGAGVAAGLAAEPLGVHVENVAIDHAELVRMHAGRRLHLGDLLRLPRVAHVVDREALGPVEARRADRADIGKALVDLDDRAAAPGADESWPSSLKFLASSGMWSAMLFLQALSRLSCPP
jgi:hypothetical protein